MKLTRLSRQSLRLEDGAKRWTLDASSAPADRLGVWVEQDGARFVAFPLGDGVGFRFRHGKEDILFIPEMGDVKREHKEHFLNSSVWVADTDDERILLLAERFSPDVVIECAEGETFTDRLFNYIGSKRLQAKAIMERVPAGTKSVYDPMAGSGAIPYECYKRGMSVHVNDVSPVVTYWLKAVFGSFKMSDGDAEDFLRAGGRSGFLASKDNLIRPNREVRAYIDGLVQKAKSYDGAKSDFAMAALANMLTNLFGSIGHFARPTLRGFDTDDYTVAQIQKKMVGSIDRLNALVLPEGHGSAKVTVGDALQAEPPEVDLAYFDPPYDIADKEEVPYASHYKLLNSILEQKEVQLPELRRPMIAELCRKLAAKCGTLLVSTSDKPTIPYEQVLKPLKGSCERVEIGFKSSGGLVNKGEGRKQTDLLWVVSGKKKELIQDPVSYDPSRIGDKPLLDDHRLTHAWYASEIKKYSKETIVNLHHAIVREMRRRGFEHHPHDALDEQRTVPNSELSSRFLSSLEDFKVIKDCICLVGSAAEGKEKPNDLDVLVRMNEPSSYLKRAIETRIIKMLPDDVIEKLHFVWGDTEGGHDDFIPLFDLMLKRIDVLKKVEMAAEPAISLLKPFPPLKSSGEPSYDFASGIAKLDPSQAKPLIVEEKFDGFRAQLHKQGDDVRIFSDQRKDITKAFPTIVSQAKDMEGDFILDGELVPNDGTGRRGLMKFIGSIESGRELDDSHIVLAAFDMLWHRGRPLDDLQLHERKKAMNTLKYAKNVVKVHSIVASDCDELRKAVDAVSKLPHSEGAMVKEFGSLYPMKDTSHWHKFRNTRTVTVVVLGKKSTADGDAWNYECGIPAPKGEWDERHVWQSRGKRYLHFGRTFNSAQEFSEGDRIDVGVQEIWRHSGKNGKRYSWHKPRVIGESENPLSTAADLDSIVDAIGTEVRELAADSVNDFPQRVQRNFRAAMESGEWLPFVMQHHERGRSLHTDARHLVPAGYLEGFTMPNPASVDDEDDVDQNAKNVFIAAIKPIQPKAWLKVQGQAKTGEPGSTAHKPGIFTIVARGRYRVWAVEDHRIGIEYDSESFKIAGIPGRLRDEPAESKSLHGKFLYSIAHIGDRHVIFFGKVKEDG